MAHQPPQSEPGADAQARLAAIVESSDDAIVSKTLQGVITSWNKGAQRIFGYAAEEVVGKPISILFPPDRLDEEPQILARLTRGERIDHFETVRVTKDGRPIEVSVTISPLRDATGTIVGASKIARDITAQKQAERDLRAARDAAEAASRAKDHFLSVLSHELRTPLTPVLAAVSLIEASPHLSAEELLGHLEMIRRNVETEARLVDDLLDVTRISRGKVQIRRELVSAHSAVRNVVSMLQGEIDRKGLAVTLDLSAKDHLVWADAGRFQQVLLNLLSNAVRFTPDEGTITVRTSNGEDASLTIDVVDSGIGIDAQTLPRLFKPFEQGEKTVTRKFGGLGLGLSIAKSLVEMHGGTITVASEGTGRGATFSLRMATAAAEPQPAPSPAAPASKATAAERPLNGFRILLVEDHDDTRRLLGRLLGSFGCVVTAAASVREAVDLANGQEFDLLVSDIGLPDGSGLDVIRRVHERQAIPGIALSGFGQDDDLRRSREAGFEQHLTKPISLQALRDVILQVKG